LVDAVSDLNLDTLSEKQKRLLRETYFEKLRDGLDPKEAIKQSLEIVLCFNM
jgi:hypothetical protein